jgi:hypothetical protein
MVCRLEPEGLAEEAFKANIFYGKSGVSRDVSGSQLSTLYWTGFQPFTSSFVP